MNIHAQLYMCPSILSLSVYLCQRRNTQSYMYIQMASLLSHPQLSYGTP